MLTLKRTKLQNDNLENRKIIDDKNRRRVKNAHETANRWWWPEMSLITYDVIVDLASDG